MFGRYGLNSTNSTALFTSPGNLGFLLIYTIYAFLTVNTVQQEIEELARKEKFEKYLKK